MLSLFLYLRIKQLPGWHDQIIWCSHLALKAKQLLILGKWYLNFWTQPPLPNAGIICNVKLLVNYWYFWWWLSEQYARYGEISLTVSLVCGVMVYSNARQHQREGLTSTVSLFNMLKTRIPKSRIYVLLLCTRQSSFALSFYMSRVIFKRHVEWCFSF